MRQAEKSTRRAELLRKPSAESPGRGTTGKFPRRIRRPAYSFVQALDKRADASPICGATLVRILLDFDDFIAVEGHKHGLGGRVP